MESLSLGTLHGDSFIWVGGISRNSFIALVMIKLWIHALWFGSKTRTRAMDKIVELSHMRIFEATGHFAL